MAGATTVAQLQAVVTADTTQADKSLKGFHKNLDDTKGHAEGAGGGVLGFTKNIAGIAAGVGVANLLSTGFGIVRDAAGDMMQAAMDSNRGIAQTNAVLASTHGVSGQTAQSIASMADQFQDLEGVDDDVTRSAANMLLTFTNIKGDVFPGATQAALDMSTALGQDSAQSAMMLGKALNDPIEGVSALRRVGVQLTDQQEKQIKTLMKHGDVAGAQKVILGELSKEFGGSAKAAGDAAGPMGKLSLVWQDVGKSIGNMLIPAMQQAATVAIGVINFFQTGGPPAKALAIIIGGVLVTAVAAYAVSMASAAVATIAATWPILAIIAIVGLLVAGIALLVQHWSQVTAFLQGVWANVVAGVQLGLRVLGQFFSDLGTTIHDALINAAKAVLEWALGLIARFQDAKNQADAKIGAMIASIVSFFASLPGKVWAYVTEMVSGFISRIRNAQSQANSAIGSVINSILDVVRGLPGKLVSLVGDAIGNMIGAIRGAAGRVAGAFGSLFSGIHLPGFAEGGIAPGGLAMVGEHGPEVVALPAGARVYPSGTRPNVSRPAATSASSASRPIYLNIHIAGQRVAQVLLPDMVDEIRRATGGHL
jgi:phage-related minor tail protein